MDYLRNPPAHAPWTLSFYQPYFNVTSKQVFTRIIRAFLGPIKWDFFSVLKVESDDGETSLDIGENLDSITGPNHSHADLWGPFWITFAAVITLVIASDTIDLLDFSSLDNVKDTWTNDFTTVTVAFGSMYLYSLTMSILLWVFSKFLEVKISLSDSLCLYGYSNSICVPFFILCTIFSGFDWMRWLLVSLSYFWSTLFISINASMKLKTDVQGTFKIYIIPILFILLSTNILMGLFVKLFFLGGFW